MISAINGEQKAGQRHHTAHIVSVDVVVLWVKMDGGGSVGRAIGGRQTVGRRRDLAKTTRPATGGLRRDELEIEGVSQCAAQLLDKEARLLHRYGLLQPQSRETRRDRPRGVAEFSSSREQGYSG